MHVAQPAGPGGASALWYKQDVAARAERFCAAHAITSEDCAPILRIVLERTRVLFGAR